MTPLEYLARGLSHFPVPPPRPGVPTGQPGDGKVPAIPWREYQTDLPTKDKVTQWASGPPMNFAIVTGAVSDIVVVDADAPDAVRWCTQHLTYTPWQVKTARGYHLYYRHPGVRVTNRARLETRDGRLPIDVRGDGGYVIGPGSVHQTGVIYQEAGDWSVAREALPRFWPGWLERPKPQVMPTHNLPRPTGNMVDRARRYLAAIPLPTIGAGSDNAVLYAACKLTRGFELSSADAESLLWEWAGNRPGWTREWIARKVANAERFGTEPIGAMR